MASAMAGGHIEGAARILVMGVGGAGSNAVDRMITADVKGVEFVSLNTDLQALGRSRAPRRIRLGERLTHGLGAGGDPSVGERAAMECREAVAEVCRGADMVFIAAGMGGGTGSGAAPVVAEIAEDAGALTVGVVTKPFAFEGSARRRHADEGIAYLREKLQTLIVIPNDRVLQVIERRTTVEMAFSVIDDVLRQGIQGISELITRPGLINLDFADVRTVMSEPGIALMAIGSAGGEDRAAQAAQLAMASPLLDLSMQGAHGVLFNVTGGSDLSLGEINSAADIIRRAADPDANIIFGAVIDESLGDEVRITVIATGFEGGDWRPWRESGAPAPGASGARLPSTPMGMRYQDRPNPAVGGRHFQRPPLPRGEPLPRPPEWMRRRP